MRLNSLHRLREIAESHAETAASHLGGLNRKLMEQQEKLELLIRYREEYERRFRASTDSGVNAAGLRNFIRFLDKLDEAITQQNEQVAIARGHAQQGRDDWQSKEIKSKAFDTLTQKSEAVAQRRDAVLKQKAQDEFAVRTAERRHDAGLHATTRSSHNRRST